MSHADASEAVSLYCTSQHPQYDHRVYVKGTYNWCVVPESGQDAILFAGVAVCAACLAQGRFSNSIILLTGAVVQGFMLPYNLGRFGNGIAIWLGIQPYELFFYIFLPPLLLDAGVRIDFYIFKKMLVQVVTLAFLVVGASVGVMIPVMLYVLDLRSSGWTWEYVALFISMLASTDAVAIISTMKTSGGPKRLRVLLEGEALLNDASSFTLFEIFLGLVEKLNTPGAYTEQNGWKVFGEIVANALKLALGGLGIGLLFGIACRYVLRFMRYMGATIDQQVALTVALAYLSYYTANAPAHVSGVVAVAVYGLYGAATSKWDMSAKVEESGAFDAFWDTLSFINNGLVFFFSGVACINFFVRSSQELDQSNQGAVLANTIWRLPLIYIFMFLFRFLLTAAFQPLFKVFLGSVSWRELVFATVGGLRGSVSLILAQAVVTDAQTGRAGPNQLIKAELVLWTAGFVLMTLIINVPLLPLVLRKTGLTRVSGAKQRMRKRAVGALANHTLSSIDNLKRDEDEMLRGVDWQSVERFVSVDGIYAHFINPELPPEAGQKGRLVWPELSQRLAQAISRKPKPPVSQKSLVGEGGKLNTSRLFGRSKGLGSDNDLENSMFPDEDEDLELAIGVDDDAEVASNMELNQLSAASGNELPFLKRESVMKPTMTRSATFASFGRNSTSLSSATSRAPLLPITIEHETDRSASSAGPAQLDRTRQAGPQTTPRHQRTRSSAASLAGRPGSSAQPNFQASLVQTSGGPLMQPWAEQPGGGEQAPAAAPAAGGGTIEENEASLPSLRITGDALRRLVTEGTTGRTWPKVRGDLTKRPPLPFTRTSSKPDPGPVEENEGSTATWSGPSLTVNSSSTSRRTAGNHKRPSVFDVFDLERAGNRTAQHAAAKHRPIFEAFGISEAGSLARADSARSAGSSKGGLEAVSSQQTWTAGMTKGADSAAFLAQLKNAAEQARTAEATSDGPPSLMERASSQAAPCPEMSESELVEARVRLVVGLKRYFHGKRIEGLLSTAALRILDTACDACLEQPGTFKLWDILEKDATGTILVTLLAQQTYFWRKVVLALRTRKSEKYHCFMYVRRALAWPLRKVVGFAHHLLAKYMLTGIEVAIEYMLSLTYSPQVQLLKRHETAGKLLDEVQEELDQVWRFILEREVEAPERFQAIQTYRATFAVQQQQQAFIKSMYDSGIVDDLERDELLRPLDKRERHLERKGPSYQPPSVLRVLHNTPFLRSAPNRVVDTLFRHGRLVMFRSGSDIAMRQSRSIYIVTSGLIKVSFTDPRGEVQEYFLASGGMLGLFHAMTGLLPPGTVTAIAEGNALGKGPVVFELYQSGINLVRKRAAAGDPVYQQIELDMLRLAALFVVERMKPRLMSYLQLLLSARSRQAGSGALPPQAPRPKLASPFDNNGDDEDESPDNDASSTAPTTASGGLGPQGQLRDAMLQQYTTLLHDLASSDVLELPAGLAYVHDSSAVLLRGTLKVSGSTDASGKENVVEYHAPFVFPRVPGTHEAPLRFVVGYQSGERTDALLMVCRPPGEVATHPLGSGMREAELPGPGAALNGDGSAHGSAHGSASKPEAKEAPVLARGSVMRQRAPSRALMLDTADTREIVAATRADGRKGAWWDNALARPSLALHRMSQLPGHRGRTPESVPEED